MIVSTHRTQRHAAHRHTEHGLADATTLPMALPSARTATLDRSTDGSKAPHVHGRGSWGRRASVGALAGAALVIASGGAYLIGTQHGVATASDVAPAPGTALAAPVHAAAPAVAPPTVTTTTSRHAAAPTRKATSTPRTTAPRHRSTRASTADGAAGCGYRAVSAGRYNSACTEYQGYVDPGRAAGRAPNSADIQTDWMDCTATKSDEQCRRELN